MQFFIQYSRRRHQKNQETLFKLFIEKGKEKQTRKANYVTNPENGNLNCKCRN